MQLPQMAQYMAQIQIESQVSVSQVIDFLLLGVKVSKLKLNIVQGNCCILSMDLMPGPQKGPKWYFQSKFSISKINGFFFI